MPRVPLTVQAVPLTGLSITFNAVTANDSFYPANGRVLLVNNGSASSITVTVPSNLTLDGLVVPDRVMTVPAGKILAFEVGGSIDEGLEADGSVWINYSATTTVTAALIQI